MENSLAQYLGVSDLSPREERAVRAFGSIAHQDAYIHRLGEGDRALYGEKQIEIRADLVKAAAEAVLLSGSKRINSLVHTYLAKVQEVSTGNDNWGRGFALNPMAIQNAAKTVEVDLPEPVTFAQKLEAGILAERSDNRARAQDYFAQVREAYQCSPEKPATQRVLEECFRDFGINDVEARVSAIVETVESKAASIAAE